MSLLKSRDRKRPCWPMCVLGVFVFVNLEVGRCVGFLLPITRPVARLRRRLRRPVVRVTLHTVDHPKRAAYFQHVSAAFLDESSSGGIQTRFRPS